VHAGEDLAGKDASQGEFFLGALGSSGEFAELMLPELRFGFVETTELPFGGYPRVDEKAFGGGGGVELLVVSGGEFFELGGILASNA
jgi:hypothetical protein